MEQSRPPYFVFDGLDLSVHDTFEAAVSDIEPIDARDVGFESFDSAGLRLRTDGRGISETGGRIFGTVAGGETRLSVTAERDPDRLRSLLVDHVIAVGPERFPIDPNAVSTMELDELAAVVADFHRAG